MLPEKNDYVNAPSNKYSTPILDVREGAVKYRNSSANTDVWVSTDCLEWNDSDGEWVINKPIYQ